MKQTFNFIEKEEAIDDTELGDFEKILNKFNLLSSEKTKNYFKELQERQANKARSPNFAQMLRFQELPSSSSSSLLKDDPATTSEVNDFEMKLTDETTNLLFDKSTKDKELKRREGLLNGLVLYNGKRTLNAETSDYNDLYYDLFE